MVRLKANKTFIKELREKRKKSREYRPNKKKKYMKIQNRRTKLKRNNTYTKGQTKTKI